MTTKILTGVYASTYSLTAPITTLSIAASGYLEAGLTATGPGAYTVANAGGIVGAGYGVALAETGVVTNTGQIGATGASGVGVYLHDGGSVANSGAGALISGAIGVKSLGKAGVVSNGGTIQAATDGVSFQGAAGTLTNDGLIESLGPASAGVRLLSGGLVVNGSASDTAALIEGATGVDAADVATVRNFGAIRVRGADTKYGVLLELGGSVTNGSASDLGALIEGPSGVKALASATVRNFGVIQGRQETDPTGGVDLRAGGLIVNGSAADTTAAIDGRYGVEIGGARGVVTNYGTVGGPSSLIAAFMGAGGVVTNGSDSDTHALIVGDVGVAGLGAPATLRNFGTIQGDHGAGTLTHAFGAYFAAGGVVTNGDTKDLTATIRGDSGVYAVKAAVTVTNFGTIAGTGLNAEGGILLNAGGRVTNGSTSVTSALITGTLLGAGAAGPTAVIANYGTIRSGMIAGKGVLIVNGGLVRNGAAADTTALISGATGVSTTVARATVVNYGTILGAPVSGGVGVAMSGGGSLTNGSAADKAALISGYVGAAVYAGGSLTNFGDVKSTGIIAVNLTDATSRLLAEDGSRVEGLIFGQNGVIDFVAGTSSVFALESSGSVVGAGTVTLNGGVSTFDPGVSLNVARINVAGAATQINVETTLAYAKTWSQTAGTLMIDTGYQFTLTGAGNTLSGAVTGPGTLLLHGGSDTLSGVTLSVASAVINVATVTLSGMISLAHTVTATTPALIVAGGGATLTGGGTLSLSNTATNKAVGASASATLTNTSDKILGAGQLGAGSLTLVNGAAGIINGNDAVALIIDTGAATIANAGVIEATGAGGTVVMSAVANTGTLGAIGGNLTVNGAVTGSGIARINGATANFSGAFNQNVVFGTSGTLELAHSTAYSGVVSGFSKTSTTALDLDDIAYSAGTTTATFSGTAASGVLTVTDGTHTAMIKLSGDYTASSFTVSSDGHGGTTIVDPPKMGGPVAFIAAAAAFGPPRFAHAYADAAARHEGRAMILAGPIRPY